jgi:hypothetical protein
VKSTLSFAILSVLALPGAAGADSYVRVLGAQSYPMVKDGAMTVTHQMRANPDGRAAMASVANDVAHTDGATVRIRPSSGLLRRLLLDKQNYEVTISVPFGQGLQNLAKASDRFLYNRSAGWHNDTQRPYSNAFGENLRKR